MKTTDKHISKISDKAREIHNQKCTDLYYSNTEYYKMVARINYYKKIFGKDVIEKFVNKYGMTDECISAIKTQKKKVVELHFNEDVLQEIPVADI